MPGRFCSLGYCCKVQVGSYCFLLLNIKYEAYYKLLLKGIFLHNRNLQILSVLEELAASVCSLTDRK